MPETLLLSAPSEPVSNPSEPMEFRHAGERRKALIEIFKGRMSLAFACLKELKAHGSTIEDLNRRTQPTDIHLLQTHGGGSEIVEVRIDIDPEVALQCYEALAELLEPFASTPLNGQEIFAHESKHFAMAHAVGAKRVQYGVSILYNTDEDSLEIIPRVTPDTDGLSALEQMHINAAPGKDMSIGDKQNAHEAARLVALSTRRSKIIVLGKLRDRMLNWLS